MAPKPKALVQTLSRRGPHRVLRGDLAFAGLPGIVCTPQAGLGLPAVVFGHGWLASPRRYLDTLAHLASWGIVAVAPATERGPVPSARAFAEDLCTAAEVAVGVRLGSGDISVQPNRLALAGHGFGAGAAVLAAARLFETPLAPVGPAALAKSHPGHTPAAVAALYPERVSPAAEDVAGRIDAPTLLLSEPGPDDTLPATAADLSAALGGDVTTRIVPAAADGALGEGRYLQKFAGLPGSDRALQRTTRALLTGYLLSALAPGAKTPGAKARPSLTRDDHAVFTDADTALPGTAVPVAPEDVPPPAQPGVVAGLVDTVVPGGRLLRLAARR